MAIAPDAFCFRPAFRLARRQAGVLHPRPIAVHPLRWTMLSHPLRGNHGEAVQGVAQRLAHTLQPVRYANRRQHMGGVSALTAPRLENLAVPTHLQKRIEQELFST